METQSDKYENLKVFIIEINPFAEFAGSGLFDWTNLKDKATLLGLLPFEFRIQEAAPPFAMKNLPEQWKAVFEN